MAWCSLQACLLLAVAFGLQTGRASHSGDLAKNAAEGKADAAIRPLMKDARESIPAVAATTAADGLTLIDDLAGSMIGNLSGMLDEKSSSSQSAALKHDTRLAAETLLLRLPVGVELLSPRNVEGM